MPRHLLGAAMVVAFAVLPAVFTAPKASAAAPLRASDAHFPVPVACHSI